MHVRFEIIQFVDICSFIQTIDYPFPRPTMLQTKFEPNWANGFNLSLNKMLFENVDRQQTTMTTAYPISSPRSIGFGELKSIKSVRACMMNISIKSYPNRAYDF